MYPRDVVAIFGSKVSIVIREIATRRLAALLVHFSHLIPVLLL